LTETRLLPQWRLPTGVTRSLWEYAQADHIAEDYDGYFAQNSLFEFDESVLARHFTRPGLIVDLGSGTGRLLVPFARRGFRGLAVDLSAKMLGVVGRKAAAENLPIDRLLVNMTELDCLRDGSADYCICMFSTLGMVRGHENRQRVLAHVRRILRPGGKFVLHVHNRWYNLFNPQGRAWLAANFFAWLMRRGVDPGDKFFDYRGIPNMFLHVFTQRELHSLLVDGGFRIIDFIALDTQRRHALRWPWFLGRLRANGWIVVSD
jgi:SAM-dependent methyltransferase